MTSKADEKRSNAYTLASARRKVAESVGGESITLRLTDDGEEFVIPHPFFYDSATKKALKNADDDDDEAQARILLGDEQYERFVAEGGDADSFGFFMLAIGQDLKASQGN